MQSVPLYVVLESQALQEPPILKNPVVQMHFFSEVEKKLFSSQDLHSPFIKNWPLVLHLHYKVFESHVESGGQVIGLTHALPWRI
jgi:hypothetical protein